MQADRLIKHNNSQAVRLQVPVQGGGLHTQAGPNLSYTEQTDMINRQIQCDQ